MAPGVKKTYVKLYRQNLARAIELLAEVDDIDETVATASEIIEKAKEHDVPLYRDHKLADTLSKLEIGEAIPPELYEVVAEILVFVDDMERLHSKIYGE